jgi:hypothetical protein
VHVSCGVFGACRNVFAAVRVMISGPFSVFTSIETRVLFSISVHVPSRRESVSEDTIIARMLVPKLV